MGAYGIFKRAVIMIPTFVVITFITFLLLRLTPGDPSLIRAQEAAGKIDAAAAARIVGQTRSEFNLDQPLLKQYFRWLMKSVRFDFGKSYRTDEPVRKMILRALPVTIFLNLFALAIIYGLAFPIGVLSALKPSGFLDKASEFLFVLMFSLPNFWVAVMLMILLGGADYLNLFPVSGYQSPHAYELPFFGRMLNILWHMFLPAVCLAVASLAFVSRLSRASFLSTLDSDYIRTAYAKGCSQMRVLFVHALKNASIPFVTLLGSLLPSVIGGSVFIERIFSIQGMGTLMFDAVLARDYPVIMGTTFLVALLVLVGLLVSDILYVALDPRIRGQKG